MTLMAIAMTVLTHPHQVLLMGMIVLQGIRAATAAVVKDRGTQRPDSARQPAPVARPSHLRAA